MGETWPFLYSILYCSPSDCSDMDFTVRENGLQLDQPPAIGNISSIMVIILKNDNVEGVIEFDSAYVNLTG